MIPSHHKAVGGRTPPKATEPPKQGAQPPTSPLTASTPLVAPSTVQPFVGHIFFRSEGQLPAYPRPPFPTSISTKMDGPTAHSAFAGLILDGVLTSESQKLGDGRI